MTSGFFAVLLCVGLLDPSMPGPDSNRSLLFTLTATDATARSFAIRFGLAEGATYAYDDALGEDPMPPSPPSPMFDFRFLDLPGRPRMPQTGSYLDIRPWPVEARADSFRVRYQPMNDAYPMRIRFDHRLQTYAHRVAVIQGEIHRDLAKEELMQGFMAAEPAIPILFVVYWRGLGDRVGRQELPGTEGRGFH